MDSPQSVVSPFKNSPVFTESDKQNIDHFVGNRGVEVQSKGAKMSNRESSFGILEVCIHQARDIHNICIYHKQDVYAKLCLTSDPENTVSTKTINGGGQNPVFNETLRLDVRTLESTLKCEIWMLSRVQNYLQDQLLGFALVPLSEVVLKNGRLEREFSLSSTDLFHSPAGFVKLSVSYSGSSLEVMAIPELPFRQDSEIPESQTTELEKIEFPDPKIVNENQMMVSEYFEISSTNMDSESSESLVSSDNTENHTNLENGGQVLKSFPKGTLESIQVPNHDSPPSSVSTNGSPSVSLHASTHSCDTLGASKSSNQEFVSPPKENPKEKKEDGGDTESEVSNGNNTFVKLNVEPMEQKVVQQDIVDMYMKSMRQFTESLAKMKLPMDGESGPTDSGNSSSDQNSPAPKSTGSRVFYGSRAFF